jgi:hypothetical protein
MNMADHGHTNAIDELNSRLGPITHRVEGSQALLRLRIHGDNAASAAKAIRAATARALADTTKTEPARKLAAANAAKKHGTASLDQMFSGIDAGGRRMAELRASLAAHLRPTDRAEASEIRQALMALPQARQYELLEQAAREQDAVVIRAVAGAHPLLRASLPADLVDRMADVYLAAVAPDEVLERDTLAEALDTTLHLYGALKQVVDTYDTPEAQALRTQVEALADEVA